MAKISVFALFDKVGKSFDRPFFIPSDSPSADGLACRALVDNVRKSPDTPLANNAKDYDIFFLCFYNESQGSFYDGDSEIVTHRVANLGDLISVQGA